MSRRDGLGRVDERVGGDLDDTGKLVLELGQRVALHLADPLAAHAQLAADLLQRSGLAVESEPQLEHTTLALRQTPEGVPDELAAEGLSSLLDVHEVEPGCLGKLLTRRILSGRSLQARPCTCELYAPLVDVRRNPDRRRLIRHRPLAGLADPPGGVG